MLGRFLEDKTVRYLSINDDAILPRQEGRMCWLVSGRRRCVVTVDCDCPNVRNLTPCPLSIKWRGGEMLHFFSPLSILWRGGQGHARSRGEVFEANKINGTIHGATDSSLKKTLFSTD